MAAGSMHARMVDSLGRRITGGDLSPGTVISLAYLEAEYGTSRTVAREAMRLLESLGMLEARRRVGLIVTDPARWRVLSSRIIEWRLAGPARDEQLRSLLELRIAVEPTAARLAAVHATAEQRARLVELAGRMRQIGERHGGDTDEYLIADVEFHLTILKASGNEMLSALDQAVEAVLVGRTRLGFTPAAPQAEAMYHHEETAHAIAAADPERAETCCRALVTVIRSELGDNF